MNMRRLAELPLFEGLDDDALKAIGGSVTEESVEAGRVIVREGDFSQDLTIIDEGSARVEREGEVLATLGPGDTFGEQGLMAKTQRNATVVAAEDMRLIHMTKFDLNRIKGSHPELVARIDAIAAARSRGLIRREPGSATGRAAPRASRPAARTRTRGTRRGRAR